ncbi:hypothetical protein THRCLA_09743 [Thraustotheca clavata]|uniref:Uncharacterized protein n=1 Tax=Thraustotheca clavata TaxID=74557 RepID=A0A1V9YUM4_9STRA|nr:hypothetical protein THRCLA_09743 [Thraustotheca clavata]
MVHDELHVHQLEFDLVNQEKEQKNTSYVERIRKSKVCRGKVEFRKELSHVKTIKPKKPIPDHLIDKEICNEPSLDIEIPQPGSNIVHRVMLVDTITQRKRIHGQLRSIPGNQTEADSEQCMNLTNDMPTSLSFSSSLTPVPQPPTALLSFTTHGNDNRGLSRTNRAIWASNVEKESFENTPTKPKSIVLSEGASIHSGDVTPQQLVAEMDVIKCILIREALLERLSNSTSTVDRLALELRVLMLPSQVNHRSSRNMLDSPLPREALQSAESPPSSKKAKRKADIQSLVQKREAAIEKLKRAFRALAQVVPLFQKATVDVAIVIDTWTKRFETPPRKALVEMPQHRHFMHNGVNYLLKLQSDVAPFFSGIAFMMLLGRGAKVHPLLLPPQLHGAEISSKTPTFLTDTSSYPYEMDPIVVDSMYSLISPHLQTVIPMKCELDMDDPKVQKALRTIFQEESRIQSEEKSASERREKFLNSYDPFKTIRQHHSVDEVFNSLLRENEGNANSVKRALRIKQENPDRLPKPNPIGPHQLHVNIQELAKKIEKKQQAATSFFGTQARQRGYVLVRKPREIQKKHPLHNHAVKIQTQFRQHRFRLSVCANLVMFSSIVHKAAINIQRVYRGHCAKSIVEFTKNEAASKIFLAHRSARKIQRVYRISQAKTYDRAKLQYLEATKRKLLHDAAMKEGFGRKMTEVYKENGRKRRMERLAEAEKLQAELHRLFRIKYQAALLIQNCFRGYLSRRALRAIRTTAILELQTSAAISIQCLTRCLLAKMHLKKLRQERAIALADKCSTMIQAAYRGYYVRIRSKAMKGAYRKRSSYRQNVSPARRRTSAITNLPIVAKPAIAVAQPKRRRRSLLNVPYELKSPRDLLPPIRRTSIIMQREELKLKDTKLGDDF